jgi:regulator of replication initiation timing
MAEEFHDAFDVGSSDEHINSINADGASFAAIQGLAERLERKTERIEELETEVARKDEQIEELRTSQEELCEENERLRNRLDAIEDRLGLDAPAET